MGSSESLLTVTQKLAEVPALTLTEELVKLTAGMGSVFWTEALAAVPAVRLAPITLRKMTVKYSALGS